MLGTPTQINVYLLTYNRAPLLKESIESILNQSYPYFELYVLDNCSEDETQSTVKAFTDDRIHYIRHDRNIGGIGNINYAIDHCEAPFFVIFHDDDIMMPWFLEKEVAAFQRSEYIDAVSGNAVYFGEADGLVKRDRKQGNIVYGSGDLFADYLQDGNYLIFPSIMYKTSFVRKHNIYLNPKVGPCADVVSYFDIERAGGRVLELSDVLMRYRYHHAQDSSVNKYGMHIALFHFLKTCDAYAEQYANNKRGREKRFFFFSKLLLFDYINNLISRDEADRYYCAFAEELGVNKDNIWKTLYEFSCLNLQAKTILRNLYRFLKNR